MATAWDEMLAAADRPRRPYRSVHGTLRKLTGADLAARADTLARTYLQQGVTFDVAGEERPFPLDVVPRVISAEEWTEVNSSQGGGSKDRSGRRPDVRSRCAAWDDGTVRAFVRPVVRRESSR